MVRGVSFAAAIASASATYASNQDFMNHYNQLASIAKVDLTDTEKAFHIAKFGEYMTENRLMGVDALHIFEEALPAVTAAKAALIAETSTFTTDAGMFNALSVREARNRMGVIGESAPLDDDEETNAKLEVQWGLPKAFSNIDAHPECPEIGVARDQGNCGSCWAFAAAGAHGDRYCIATKGKMNLPLSTGYLTSCTDAGSCEGGWPDVAWKVFAYYGIPTGGELHDLGTGKTCQPYPLHRCGHRMEIEGLLPCSKSDVRPDDQSTPECVQKCTDSKYGRTFNEDLKFSKGVENFRLKSSVKRTLMKSGPLSTNYAVYEDFLVYKEGVYAPGPNKGVIVGYHAVKLIGWGVDKKTGVEYWEAVNSWNEHWGENGGRFRVAMNANVFGGFYGAESDLTRPHLTSEAEEIRM